MFIFRQNTTETGSAEAMIRGQSEISHDTEDIDKMLFYETA